MTSGGIDALRSDLDRIDEALDAFDAPVVDDRPGLRWMRDVLRARHEHVRQSLREAEMTALAATVEAAPSTRWTVRLVAQLTSVLQDAIEATARRRWEDADGDTDLVVRSVTGDDGSLRIVLERPEGPLEALRVDDGGRPRIDAAVEALVEAIEDQSGDELAALADLVIASGLVATIEARCIDRAPRAAVVDQAVAARMHG